MLRFRRQMILSHSGSLLIYCKLNESIYKHEFVSYLEFRWEWDKAYKCYNYEPKYTCWCSSKYTHNRYSQYGRTTECGITRIKVCYRQGQIMINTHNTKCEHTTVGCSTFFYYASKKLETIIFHCLKLMNHKQLLLNQI